MALCLGAAAILAVAAFWNIAMQREHMTALLTANAASSADLVHYAARDAMLENAPGRLRGILARLGEHREVERIRIFNRVGRVQYSTREGEVGHFAHVGAPQCSGCHQEGFTSDSLEPERRVREFADAEGLGVLAVTTPIPNEPACSTAACHEHPPDLRVLGVLDVQLHLEPVEQRVQVAQRQMAITLAVTAVALVLVSALLVWRLVIRPVRRLTEVTRRVADGDLGARAPVTSSDEIGELTHTWNDTVAQLAAARVELENLIDTLEERVGQKTEEVRKAHERMLEVEKMASLGKLAAVVAHEVNNPLAGIATYARLLRRRAARGSLGEDGEAERMLELVESEAARCGEIVRNLLLFSRTPGRHFALTDLRVVLQRCVLLFRHQADLQEVDVELEVAADLPEIVCDASQVQQLVLALSMNAIEAMPDGGRLRICADRGAQETVVLKVIDTGPGIGEADIAHVFEPFYTTKPEGKGVGLGLAVVYGITKRHGGSAGVTSEIGMGSTFTVRLPIVPPEPEDDEQRLLEGVIS